MEEFRPVVGFENTYEVSNYGSIRRRLRPLLRAGYRAVTLQEKRHKVNAHVHALVIAAFQGPRPAGMYIDHIDGNKLNNHISNLEYVTPKENRMRAKNLGLIPHRSKRAKLTENDIINIRKSRLSNRTLAKQYSVSHPVISYIRAGKTYKELPGIADNQRTLPF